MTQKTIVNPAANYLLVSVVDLEDFSIVNGVLQGQEKDVIAKVGYVEKFGKNTDLPSDTLMVIFNSKLGTKIKDDSDKKSPIYIIKEDYLIHKSAILATISKGTIVCNVEENNDIKSVMVFVDERLRGMSLETIIKEFGSRHFNT